MSLDNPIDADENTNSTVGTHQPGLFKVRDWIFALSFVAGAAGLTLYAGFDILRNTHQQRFQSDAETMLGDVGQRITEIRGVLKSMLGTHYASDEFAGMDMSAFAEQLRNYSPFVKRIGLFGVVDSRLRSDYEELGASYMSHSFVVHSYDENGTVVRHTSESDHYPLISANPLDTKGIEMLGLDLGADPDIARVIETGIVSGKVTINATPERWQIDGTAILLQPVYFSERPPSSELDRTDLYAGGIWLTIDTNALFGDISTDSASTFSVVSQGINNTSTLFSRPGKEQAQGLSTLLGNKTSSRIWHLGDSKIHASLERSLKVNSKEIRTVFASALISTLLAISIIGILYQRRTVHLERVKSLEAIGLERQKAEHALESLSDPVVSVDANASIVFVNPAAQKCFNLTSADWSGEPLDSLIRIDTPENDHQQITAKDLIDQAGQKGRVRQDVLLPASNNPAAVFQLSFSRMLASKSEKSGYLLVFQDVSTERKLTAELEHQAHHDALLNVYNRNYFEQKLSELVADVSVSSRQHALFYIDLDQFKIVNDTCGHQAGDRLLCELTEALTARLRDNDILARLGGDEFGVIICDVDEQETDKIARQFFSHFRNAVFEHEGNIFPVRCSMGVVVIDKRFDDLEVIMSSADIACYSAKTNGRNNFVTYSDTDQSMSRHREEMNWLPRLEKALKNDEFTLLVQPILSLHPQGDENPLNHYEFLLRLVDEDGAEVSPFSFIQAAERFDLMNAIDRWVIDRGLRMVSEAGAALDEHTVFSLNLSGQSAADPRLLSYIADRLEEYQLAPSRFWFEITETAAISHFDNAVALFEGLHNLGAKVALDDFGSGLSSFAYLRALPLDILKIDGQLVRDVVTCPTAKEIVRAIHHVATSMNLETVAEFVENDEAINVLRQMNIHYAQGYGIGKPASFEESVVRGYLDKAA